MTYKVSKATKKISIFAPASIGNVSVGFDILGLCVKSQERTLGDIVHIEESAVNEFHLSGLFSDVLPNNSDDNLVIKAKSLFLESFVEAKSSSVKLTLEKHLPICSGLGSSASSVVATIHALNEFYDKPLSQYECLKLMGQCEAAASGSLHYDNIAPSYLGGLTLCSNDKKLVHHLPWPKEWKIILAYADIDIPTIEARGVLPNSYSKRLVIEHSQNLAQFIHALHTSDLELASHSLIDLIAEPYRESLLPNYRQVKASLLGQFAAKAVGISGSGPTIFAIVDNASDIEGARQYLQTTYVDQTFVSKTKAIAKNERGFVLLAEVNKNGAESVIV